MRRHATLRNITTPVSTSNHDRVSSTDTIILRIEIAAAVPPPPSLPRPQKNNRSRSFYLTTTTHHSRERKITRIESFGHLCVVHVLPKLRHRERALYTRGFEFSRPPSFPRSGSLQHACTIYTYTYLYTRVHHHTRVFHLCPNIAPTRCPLPPDPTDSPIQCIHTRAHRNIAACTHGTKTETTVPAPTNG